MACFSSCDDHGLSIYTLSLRYQKKSSGLRSGEWGAHFTRHVTRILIRGGGGGARQTGVVRLESRPHMPIHKLLSFLLFLIQSRIKKFFSVDLPFSLITFFFLENLFLSSVSSSAQGGAIAPVPPPPPALHLCSGKCSFSQVIRLPCAEQLRLTETIVQRCRLLSSSFLGKLGPESL